MNIRVIRLMVLFPAAIATAGCAANVAGPEEYPLRPIKVIVPFSPGGETDTFGRIIKMAIDKNDLVPQSLVIFNRDGAGATVGSRSVKNARPDGYTVLLLHNALFTAKYSGNVAYGPEAFEPVAGTGEFGMVVAVAASSKIDSLKMMMAKIKDKPKSLTFGVNRGTPSHFAALMLENAVPGAHFQFAQSGSGVHRYSDVRGGHVDASAFSIGEYVRFDGLRALAIFGDKRHPGEPDLPTAKEQGFDLTTSNMQFWWFPKGTPKKRVDYFAGVLEKAMQTKYVKKRLAEIHCEPEFIKGKELQKRIDEYTGRLEKISLRPSIALPNVPAIVLCSILGLCGLIVAQRWTFRNRKEYTPQIDIAPSSENRITAVALIGLTIVYAVALSLEVD